MRVQHHIGFRLDSCPDLFQILNMYNISFDKNSIIQGIDVYEDEPCWVDIKPFVDNKIALDICTPIFSNEELNNASWLKVRSVWHNGYPQPEHTIKFQRKVYDINSLCEKCSIHNRQKESFCIKSNLKWKNRHFFMLNWVFDELFVDDVAKNILNELSIPGVSFRDVKNTAGNSLDNVYQLEIHNILGGGFLPLQKYIESKTICPECGNTKYFLNNKEPITFQKNFFDGVPDIVKSSEWFGDGFLATRLILINKKIYKVLVDNDLVKNLEFQPINLI